MVGRGLGGNERGGDYKSPLTLEGVSPRNFYFIFRARGKAHSRTKWVIPLKILWVIHNPCPSPKEQRPFRCHPLTLIPHIVVPVSSRFPQQPALIPSAVGHLTVTFFNQPKFNWFSYWVLVAGFVIEFAHQQPFVSRFEDQNMWL